MREAKETIGPPGNLNTLLENRLEPMKDLFIIHTGDILSIFVAELQPNEKLGVVGKTPEDAVLGLHLRAAKSDTGGRDHNLENSCQVAGRLKHAVYL